MVEEEDQIAGAQALPRPASDVQSSSPESSSVGSSEAVSSRTHSTSPSSAPKRPSGHVMPAAAWHAKCHSIDTSLISGTGPGGRILKSDVLQAIKTGTAFIKKEADLAGGNQIAKAMAGQKSNASSRNPLRPPRLTNVRNDFRVDY